MTFPVQTAFKLCVLAACALGAAPVAAKPSWAEKPDLADASGHSFVCEGAGRSEQDALAAASAVCNDKICRVCGVEVVSTLQTKETLKGVDVERQITERCRRVRKREPDVRYKSVDCGPEGCTAWIQVLYSKDDERAECSRYADENFADPARCEQDIDDFAKTEGRSAESFVNRRASLEAALKDCRDIDVRPTPAIMAMDAKLFAGMDGFEVGSQPREGTGWTYFLRPPARLRDELKQTSTLIGRIQIVRDYVHSRALIFAAYDAAQAKDLDTPTGIQRLLAAMRAAPKGRSYGSADDINFFVLPSLREAKSDVTAVEAFMRHSYPVESLEPRGDFLGQDGRLASFFAADGKVGQAEWDYAMGSYQLRRCNYCLHRLLEAREHGGDHVRLGRLLAAYGALGPDEEPSPINHAHQTFMPLNDAAFLLRIEPKLPAAMQSWYDGRMWEQVLSKAKRDKDADLKTVAERYLRALAGRPVTEKERDYCDDLTKRVDEAVAAGATGVERADPQICWCLNGSMKELSDRYYGKQHLVERSIKRKLGCRCPYEPNKTHASFTVLWKAGQAPRHYGKYADGKIKIEVKVDPLWHACASKDETARLNMKVFYGQTAAEALEAEYSSYDVMIRLDEPVDTQTVAGVGVCNDKPKFVAWALAGEGEYMALDSERHAQAIACE